MRPEVTKMNRMLALAALLVACGGDIHVTAHGPSCASALGGFQSCVDFIEEPGGGVLETMCATVLSGTYNAGPCSRANAIGGCSKQAAGGIQTVTWYYSDSGLTSDQARQGCSLANGAFVVP
jgi:hypothetical protein